MASLKEQKSISEIEKRLGLFEPTEMTASGIGITEALAFWNEMMNRA
jgi:hypothetical protein